MPPRHQKAFMTTDELRALMTEKGIESQADLARALDVHPVTVYRWFAGKSVITERTALLIRDRLKRRKK